MLKFKGMILAAVTVAGLIATTPAYADFCLQLNGGSFSGDLGFFRFKKSRPTGSGAIMAMRGRVAGLSPVFGTATVAKDGSFLEIGATFFADGEQGQIDVSFFPPNHATGNGSGNYGAYGTSQSFTVTEVSCNLEP